MNQLAEFKTATPNSMDGDDLGGGFKNFLFPPLPGEMIEFDEHIFQAGWFNHQLVVDGIFIQVHYWLDLKVEQKSIKSKPGWLDYI